MSLQGPSDDSHDLNACAQSRLRVSVKSWPGLSSLQLFDSLQSSIQKHRPVAEDESCFE